MGPGVSTPSERAWPVHMYGSIGQRVGLWWSRKEERNNKKEDAGVFSQNMPKKQFRSIQDELKGKTKIQRYKTVVFYNFTQHDKKLQQPNQTKGPVELLLQWDKVIQSIQNDNVVLALSTIEHKGISFVELSSVSSSPSFEKLNPKWSSKMMRYQARSREIGQTHWMCQRGSPTL